MAEEHRDKPLSPRAQAALARMHIELGRERYEAAQDPQPTAFDHVPAALGLPVPLFDRGVERPWVTWTSCAASAVLGLVLWRPRDDEPAIEPGLARLLDIELESDVAPHSILSAAFESAFTPDSLGAWLASLWLLHLFGGAAESLIGHARALALLAAGLSVALLAQLALHPTVEVAPLFLLGPTAAAAAFVALREPFARVGVLLGFGFALLHAGGSPWLRLPLWLWSLLWAAWSSLHLGALEPWPIWVAMCAAAVGLAAAAPALVRRFVAQPSPSTRL